MRKILILLSTSFVLISAFESLYADGSIALFGKRQVVASQNALLRQTQQQMDIINSNPEAKLAYLRSMRQGLGAKEEIARVAALPPEQRADALKQLYARLRADNQNLKGKQMSMFGGGSVPGLPNFSGGLSLPGMPDFATNQMNSEDNDGESTMNDVGLYYRAQRLLATSPTAEVGPDDYMVSLRQNRLNAVSDAETSPDEVRNFMRRRR
ncbi:MAG TPA: hypothetical protein DIC42_03515 [Holosporales bacterium]|nr:hypothetical protein [Holosporales bacterium]